MEDVAYGKTANRQVIGMMVDFAKALEFYVDDRPSPLDLSLRLARTPCSPLYKTTVSPDRATVALFDAPALRLVRSALASRQVERAKNTKRRGVTNQASAPPLRRASPRRCGRGTSGSHA